MKEDFILKINKLNISFPGKAGTVHAVKDLSYKLHRSNTLGIVGESGSGKSVSSLAVMRLLPEHQAEISGEIWYHADGEWIDLLKVPRKSLPQYRGKQISMIFQEPMSSLNPSMKCGPQVDEAILLHDTRDKEVAKKRTLELFERVQLPSPERIYDAYPHQLSGGQIQRVMISMAISCRPKILIADEPTTALDVTVQKEVIELLKEIQEEYGMSMIFISHDLGVINQIADQVLVMNQGASVEYGDLKNIFQNPEQAYTKGLLACRPPLNYKMERLPTVSDFVADKSLTAEKFRKEHLISGSNGVKSNADVILRVDDLSTWYPQKRNFFGKPTSYVKALNNVSFDVHRGECLGLVGESGSGKSTLSKTIMLLEKRKGGEVYFEGNSIMDLEGRALKDLRKRLQIVFQDPYSSLNPRLSVGYAISEPMLVHNMVQSKSQAKEKTIHLLETVGLKADHYSRYPHEFSGGQRQRIVIARALGLEPKFLICDECVSALDVSVQAQIVNLLLDLKKQLALSYIFISHDLAIVQFISDRIIVMKDGKIVETGNSAEIIQNPKTEYTRKLIDSVPK